MNELVREWAGTAASVRRALELADARGQLVSFEPLRAGPSGVAVRVVLRPTSTRTPTGPRQTTTRPRQRRWVRWSAVVAIVLLLSGALFWVLYTYWAVILGTIVVALLVLLAQAAGGGGDSHPCNR